MRGLSNSTIALLQMWQPSQPSLVSLQPAPRSVSTALRSRHTARIDALYEVGDLWLLKHVLLSTPQLAPVLMRALLRFGHGAHLSRDQAAEFVKSWLKHHGVFFSISMTHGGGPAVRVNGDVYDPSRPGIDGSTRTQYSETVAYPALLIFDSVGGDLQVVAQKQRAKLISHSNGKQDPPPEYATALCNLFAQFGGWASARGDDGVGRGNCKDGSGQVWLSHTSLHPFRSVGGELLVLISATRYCSGVFLQWHAGPYLTYRFAATQFLIWTAVPGAAKARISVQVLRSPIVVDIMARAGTSCSMPVHLSLLPPSSALRRPSSSSQ
ncbi:hypothetical protein EDB83DRAFT_2680378 [Lactarius deliciosus]|nr:hypothetical protein EDB83DRAFT_2680378 [Lactarius deliciosus]